MWQELAIAFSLFLVLEGLLPFASPRRWRNMMSQLVQASDNALRMVGFVSMMIGLLLLVLISN